ncbi:MAG: nucleotide sugar dehydrogenase [Nitrospirae bacterium]|nr:nucleotide sugar dehydrogenase [Nitrospirota bacterium]
MVLLNRIKDRRAEIGVIGLGYVGLPLVREFVKAGFHVTGFDLDEGKVKALKAGRSYIKHIPSKEIAGMMKSDDPSRPRKHLTPTSDFSLLSKMDCIVICVPTPLNEYREPDLSYVFNTTRVIAENLKKDQLIVLESTTYPGTTDEDMRAILEGTGLKAGRDFHLAFSPEREDPNNPLFSTRTIPKVVGGYTGDCLKVACAMYDCIVEKTVKVSSTKAAEATKLLENIFRSVNIAMVNEMKMLFDRMGIDIWEVINAAATKPFGYTPFYPGPGLGGHCIPIDPFYLTWKAREFDFSTRFIELAGEINSHMPYYVVQKTVDALNERGKSIKKSRVLILGIAYKKDVDDMRESPSLKLIELFRKKGALVDYNDPLIPEMPRTRHYNFRMKSVRLTNKTVGGYDAVVIATDHSDYDYEFLRKNAKLIIDTRNAVSAPARDAKVVKS